MRVGIACYPSHGGSGVIASELALGLAERGHQVHIVSYAVPFRLRAFHPNVLIHEVEVSSYPCSSTRFEKAIMTLERAHAGWFFWLSWFLASTAGLTLGFVVVAALEISIYFSSGWLQFLPKFEDDPLMRSAVTVLGVIFFAAAYAVAGGVGGSLLGIMQWFVLRRHLSDAARWIGVTAVGSALCGLLLLVIMQDTAAVVRLGVIGALIGILQWSALRREVPRAYWWVLACAVSSAVGGAGVDSRPRGFAVVWDVATASAVTAAITGIVLLCLLRQPIREHMERTIAN